MSSRHNNRQDIQSAAVHKSHAYKKLASTTRRSSSFYTIHVSALYHPPPCAKHPSSDRAVGFTNVRPNDGGRYAFKARFLHTLHTRHLSACAPNTKPRHSGLPRVSCCQQMERWSDVVALAGVFVIRSWRLQGGGFAAIRSPQDRLLHDNSRFCRCCR